MVENKYISSFRIISLDDWLSTYLQLETVITDYRIIVYNLI